jgi:hypothetical protein
MGDNGQRALIRQLRLAVLLALLLSTVMVWAVSWQARVIQGQSIRIHEMESDSLELLLRRMQEQKEKRIKQTLEHMKLAPAPGASLGCLPRQTCG